MRRSAVDDASEVLAVRRWVHVSHAMDFHAGDLRDLLRCLRAHDRVEEAIDERVGVALSRHANEATMEEARVLQHFPDRRVTPIVGNLLRINLDFEVVVAAGQTARARLHLVDVEAQ